MIQCKISGIYIICDKCYALIRADYNYMMTTKAIKKYENKKSYCGRCIQERIHRGNSDWSFEKEFKCDNSSIPNEKHEKDLELLLSCMM